jgi:hypothetical protein
MPSVRSRASSAAPRVAHLRPHTLAAVLALVVLAMLPSAASARLDAVAPDAADVFLSPTGSDANPCSRARPCRGLDRAYALARLGQTVELAAGVYEGDHQFGAPAKNGSGVVVFRPASGAAVTVGGITLRGQNHVEFRDLTVNSWFLRRAQDVTFRNIVTNFFFIRSSDSVRVLGGSVGPIQDGTSPTIGNYTGEPPSSNVLVDRVLFHDIGRRNCPGCHVECLFLQESNGVVIRNSKFTRCDIMDLYVSPTQGGPTASNVLVENNWFDTPTDGGYYAVVLNPDPGTDPKNFVFRYNSLDAGLLIYPEPTYAGSKVIGNIGRVPYCGQVGITYAGNVWANQRCGPTDRVAAAGYVDSEAFDFRLKPDSRAIGAAPVGTAPAVDLEGDRRPIRRAPDAGADQREPAVLSLAGVVGRARLGMTEATIRGLYGRPRSVSRRKLDGGGSARVARYRAPGGLLWTVSEQGRVVGVGTSSSYYVTGTGFGVGAKRSALSPRAVAPCGRASISRRAGRDLVLTARGDTVTTVEIARRGFSPC